MANFEFVDRNDFQKIVDAQIEETLTLEYKASVALTRHSKEITNFARTYPPWLILMVVN